MSFLFRFSPFQCSDIEFLTEGLSILSHDLLYVFQGVEPSVLPCCHFNQATNLDQFWGPWLKSACWAQDMVTISTPLDLVMLWSHIFYIWYVKKPVFSVAPAIPSKHPQVPSTQDTGGKSLDSKMPVSELTTQVPSSKASSSSVEGWVGKNRPSQKKNLIFTRLQEQLLHQSDINQIVLMITYVFCPTFRAVRFVSIFHLLHHGTFNWKYRAGLNPFLSKLAPVSF